MCREGAGSAAVYAEVLLLKGETATMYQALYRKWRPKTFSDVVGQQHITETLRRQIADGRTSHAYLFTGTRGTGKTTCAKILAKALNCEHPVDGDPCNTCASCLAIESGLCLDVIEMDAASNNGVDNVRTLRDEAIYPPAQVKKRVYIIDEVHMLTSAAFNALLKILEEPPEHLVFILATTELHKVLPTILSRCQRFSFKRILPKDIASRLAYIAKEENITLTDDGAEILSRLANGALRDALSLLDQCASGGNAVDRDTVLQTLGLSGNVQTVQLMEYILRRDTSHVLSLLGDLYQDGKDVGSVLGELASLARDLLISRTASEGGESLLSGGYTADMMQPLQSLCPPARLIYICTVLQETAGTMQWSTNRRTDAELCLLRLCDETLGNDLTALAARVARLEEGGLPIPAPALKEEVPPVTEDAPPFDPDEPIPTEEPPVSALQEEESAPDIPEPQEEPTTPQKETPSAETSLYPQIIKRAQARLDAGHSVFFNQTSGEIKDGILMVYCPNDFVKTRLDNVAVLDTLLDIVKDLGTEAKCVSLQVGTPEGFTPPDKMNDLLNLGNKFSGFTVK